MHIAGIRMTDENPRRTATGLLEAAHRRIVRAERKLHRQFLRHPHRVTCTVCGWSGPILGASRNPRHLNRLCPSCRSSERYRALELLLDQRGPVPNGTRLLEVAPIDTVRRTAERLGYTYTSIDLKSPRAMVLSDLCALPFADGSFDVIICFHVLEHIPADLKAVQELARVAGTGGEAIIVVPAEPDRPVTFEVPDADPKDYERLYGQSDHVRIYGGDIEARWNEADIDLHQQRWADLFDQDTFRRAALRGDDDRFWFVRATPHS